MNNESLGVKSFKAILWSIVGKLLNQTVGFGMGIILARLIAPQHYGQIAMAFVVIAITNVFVDSGFSLALIRKKHVREVEYDTVFWFNLAISAVIYTLIFLFSHSIERFFNTENFVPVIRWIGVIIVINSLSLVQYVQLTRSMNFLAINLVAFYSAVISGVVGVVLAYRGWGIYALVAQQITASFTNVAAYFYYCRWLPRWIFSLTAIRGLWKFSSNILAGSIIAVIFDNIYSIVVGRWFSAEQLAYFNRADSYQQLLGKNIAGMVQAVSFPALSQIQDDIDRMRDAYRRLVQMTMMVVFPAMLGLLIIAPQLIEWLLTAKWLPTAPYLRWLCIEGLLYPLHAINLNILHAKGRSDIFLKLEVVKKLLLVMFLLYGFQWGVEGLVVAKVMHSITVYFLNAYFSLRLLHCSIVQQLLDVFPYAMLSLAMIGMLSLIALIPLPSVTVLVLTQVVAGIIFYFGGCWLFKLSAFVHLRQLFQQVLLQRRF